MILREKLESKKSELEELKSRIADLEKDIEALERVISMEDSSSTTVVSEPYTGEAVSVGTVYVSARQVSAQLPNMDFGRFLNMFCLENGLSNKDLAELVGVSDVSIGNWIRGKSKIGESSKSKIALKIQELSANEYRASEIMSLPLREKQ